MRGTDARNAELLQDYNNRKNLNPQYTVTQYSKDTGIPLSVLFGRLRRAKEANGEPIRISPGGDQVTRIEDSNNLDLEVNSSRIHTLEQLLQFCEVDLNIWSVERYTVNKWEVGAKNPYTGAVVVEPLYQVKASLIRKVPELVHPVIQPVYIKLRKTPRPTPRTGLKLHITLPDPQFGFSKNQQNGELIPFHDIRALDIALQIVMDLKPDSITWLQPPTC